jgi:hypothetical protein
VFLAILYKITNAAHSRYIYSRSRRRSIFKALAADCTVIAADHPESAASGVIADADFGVEPTVEALAEQLDAGLGGARSPTSPVDHAQQCGWNAIVERAETAYRRVTSAVFVGDILTCRLRGRLKIYQTPEWFHPCL